MQAGADAFGLHDFDVEQFQDEAADLGEIRRIAASLFNAPDLVLQRQCHFLFGILQP